MEGFPLGVVHYKCSGIEGATIDSGVCVTKDDIRNIMYGLLEDAEPALAWGSKPILFWSSLVADELKSRFHEQIEAAFRQSGKRYDPDNYGIAPGELTGEIANVVRKEMGH